MATVTSRLRLSGCAVLAGLALGAPAEARADEVTGCPPQPLAQKFLPWADVGWYEIVPDGGLEAGAKVWTLSGGAQVVLGNESFFIGSRADALSLSVPRGGSARTASVCLGLGDPTIRFFVKHEGSPFARLTVSVVIGDPKGQSKSLPIGVISGGRGWAPSPPLPVTANVLSPLPGMESAFQFTPDDDGGKWYIDDVYVDPYGKG